MISDLDKSLGSRYFLNVAYERTCFASCACAFKLFRVDHLFGMYFNLVPTVFVPLDQRSENESSGSNHFE